MYCYGLARHGLTRFVSLHLLPLLLLCLQAHAQEALQSAEFLARLGLRARNGSYSSSTDVELQASVVRLVRPTALFPAPAPLLCNLVLQGRQAASELDASGSWLPGQNAFRIGRGCTVVIRNILLQVTDLTYVKALPQTTNGSTTQPSPSPAQSLSLSPAFAISPGGLLILEGVTIRAAGVAAFYSSICNAWSYSASAELDSAGVLRLTGEHATSTGLLLRNVTILPAEGVQPLAPMVSRPAASVDQEVPTPPSPTPPSSRPPAPPGANSTASPARSQDSFTLPCRASTAQDAASLSALLLGSLEVQRPLYISLTGNVTIDPDAWKPVGVAIGASFTLLGDPRGVTQIDFAGVLVFLYLAQGRRPGSQGVSPDGVVRFQDLTIINAVAWDAPSSIMTSLTSTIQPVMTRRTDLKLVGSPYQPQVMLLRCTVYVPDAEAEWMRYALPPVSLFKPPQESVNAVWSWVSWMYLFVFNDLDVKAHGSGPKGGTYVSHLVHKSGFVAITQSLILPVSAYPDQSQVLPEARRWLLHELLGKPQAFIPVSAMQFIRHVSPVVGPTSEYHEVLERLTGCLMLNRPSQIVITSSGFLADATLMVYMKRLRDVYLQGSERDQALLPAAIAANNISYLAFGPGSLSQVPNCSLLSVPNPRGIPRSTRGYDTGDYLTMRPDQNIYKLLDAGNISGTVFDLQGMHAELIVDPTKTINIGRMIIMNLAPGGYAYDWATSRMLPVDGWAEAQGPLAAGFANQSLPVWWLQANRSSIMPVLQLYGVMLVVPQEEMELMHALMQAVAVLRQRGLTDSVIASYTQRNVNTLAAAQERHAQPHIVQMLQYAMTWEVEFSSNTSLRFRRWSYLGVAGEGVSITSQLPKDNNASMTVSRVADATAGLLGLAADVSSFTGHLTRSISSIFVPAPPFGDASAPVALSPIAAAAAQSSPPNNALPTLVLALSVSAGIIALLLAVTLIVLMFVRKRRLLQQAHASAIKQHDRSLGSFSSTCLPLLSSGKKLDSNSGQGCVAGSSKGCSLQLSGSTEMSVFAAYPMCARAAAMSEVRALQAQLRAQVRPGMSPSTRSKQCSLPDSKKACSLDGPGPVLLSGGSALLPPQQPVAMEAVLWLRTQGVQRVPAAIIRSMAPSSSIAAGRTGSQLKEQPSSSAEHAVSFGAQLVLGPVLGQGACSVVHIGTWNMMPVAVKMVVVQEDGPKASTGQRGAMLVKGKLQKVLSEVAIATCLCHPSVVACLSYDLQPLSALQPMASTSSSMMQWPWKAMVALTSANSAPTDALYSSSSAQGAAIQNLQQDGCSLILPGWPAAAAVPNGVVLHVRAAHNGAAGVPQSVDSGSATPLTSVATAARVSTQAGQLQAVGSIIGHQASTVSPGVLKTSPSGKTDQLQLQQQHDPSPSTPGLPLNTSTVAEHEVEYVDNAPATADSVSVSKASHAGAWRLCMVLEYCNHGTLHELIESGTLTPQWVHALSDAPSGAPLEPGAARDVEVLLLAWQVAVGMDYLASLGVVHGGLCASNVLLHSLPESESVVDLYVVAGYDMAMLPAALNQCNRLAKITDFHGATRLQPEQSHAACQPGGVRDLYAAPELLHGGVPSEACDVYSFGVLLLELWYGMPAVQIAEAHGGSLLPDRSALPDGLLPRQELGSFPALRSKLPSIETPLAEEDKASSCGAATLYSRSLSPNEQLQTDDPGTHAKDPAYDAVCLDSGFSPACSSSDGFSLDGPVNNSKSGPAQPPMLLALIERCLSPHAPQRPTCAQLHMQVQQVLEQHAHWDGPLNDQ